jgi:hypothetical protein
LAEPGLLPRHVKPERITMTRNRFKVLGLAFIAVLAMSAIGATASQAAPQFTCSKYPCTATGTSAEGAEVFTTPGGTVTCHASYVVEGKGTNTDIHAATSVVTVTPTYSNCKAFGFLNATVNMTGCDYEFTATEATVLNSVYDHHVAIRCPIGKSIDIVASTCEVDVGEAGNTSLTQVKTTNLADGRVTVTPEIGPAGAPQITMNVTKDGFLCPFAGTGHVKGSYHGHVIIHNSEAGQTLSVSGA